MRPIAAKEHQLVDRDSTRFRGEAEDLEDDLRLSSLQTNPCPWEVDRLYTLTKIQGRGDVHARGEDGQRRHDSLKHLASVESHLAATVSGAHACRYREAARVHTDPIADGEPLSLTVVEPHPVLARSCKQ